MSTVNLVVKDGVFDLAVVSKCPALEHRAQNWKCFCQDLDLNVIVTNTHNKRLIKREQCIFYYLNLIELHYGFFTFEKDLLYYSLKCIL